MRRPTRLLAGVLGAGLLTALALGGVAHGADQPGTIAHVESDASGLQILVTVPAGARLDLSAPEVTIAGEPAEATAAVVDDATPVRRTSVLVIDTSNSMRGARFRAARDAAESYVSSVPDDVYVGIVGFDADVATLLSPSQDRARALDVISRLTLSRETSLYDGVIAAAAQAGIEGQRTLLILSDGADTSDTLLEDAVAAVEDNELIVDAVALDQGGVAVPGLAELAAAGGGQLIPADPAALQAAFAAEAQSLANQVLVTATLPASVVEAGSTEAELTVRLAGADATDGIAAESYSPITVPATAAPETAVPSSRAGGVQLPTWAAYAGPAALGLGLVAVLVLLVPRAPAPLTPEQRVSRYAADGTRARSDGGPRVEAEQTLHQARGVAADLLERNKTLEARISKRLEAAGSDLRSAEWLLVHGGVFVVVGLLGLLLSQGNLAIGILFLLLGVFAPWVYLGLRASRRRKAFSRVLPDTLQLMSGSLSAGLSLAQSVDTIVREGPDPIKDEFKRVLVETRLGVSLEDAFDGISERFQSKDFAWVVMAIRIQRQVGGNLAELLNTVAETMREREYMRRQVAALAAEGKLSAYVLGGLPPLFLLYLLLTNRDYVIVLFTEPLGLLMLAGAGLLLTVGGFWMSKLIKVEV